MDKTLGCPSVRECRLRLKCSGAWSEGSVEPRAPKRRSGSGISTRLGS
jgi:hypothetical protein